MTGKHKVTNIITFYYFALECFVSLMVVHIVLSSKSIYTVTVLERFEKQFEHFNNLDTDWFID